MNCENVDKLISAYVDREVPADLEPKIRYHLAYCKRCFKAYSEMQRTKELLSSLKSHELPDSFWRETRAKLRRHRSVAEPKRRLSKLWTALAAAACLLLAVSVVSLAPNPPQGSGFVASSLETTPAEQFKTMSLTDSANTGGQFSYARSPIAARRAVQFASFGHEPPSFGIFDFGEILWANSFDVTEDNQPSDAETNPEPEPPVVRERDRQTFRTYFGSPNVVPAGWSGGQ
ncbi:MAG: anti-sigma factor [Bacillota bacterium]|jgi:anti-sigma factor RsiW|nr:hypothetical protein [Bacillota bacterium]HOB90901.1 anti-sigma factor [Bacillota bacterium]HPZ54923.1 anti-sigma factor [Bacillota bacterium]HQD18034.1 anti-sigma factor [Bacillota bacterium]